VDACGRSVWTLETVATMPGKGTHLGLWGTARGDVAETKRKVVEKTREALELMRHHPLTEKLIVSLCTSIGVGAFRYSAALVP